MGIGHGPAHGGGHKDRVVPVGHTIDLDKISGVGADAGIIPGIFPERTFGHKGLGIHFAFDDDLGRGRNRQVIGLRLDDLDGPTPDRAGQIIFGFKGRQAGRTHEEQQGVAADHHGHRHGFFHGLVFLEHDIGMFAFDKLGPQMILVQQLQPVGPQIDPAGIRVFGDDEVGRAEKTPPVLGEEFGHGKLE